MVLKCGKLLEPYKKLFIILSDNFTRVLFLGANFNIIRAQRNLSPLTLNKPVQSSARSPGSKCIYLGKSDLQLNSVKKLINIHLCWIINMKGSFVISF